MFGMELILACAPQVAPEMIEQIIQVESSGNPLAINVNVRKGEVRPRYKRPSTAAEAAATVTALIAAGYSVDMGVMQVNSKNLPKLGYTVTEMFEPCTNISAGAQILTSAYRSAAKQFGGGQQALLAALSAYNTGNFRSGFTNRYVYRYLDGTGAAPSRSQYMAAQFDPSDETTVFTRKETPSMTPTTSNTSYSMSSDDDTVVFSRSMADTAVPGVMVQVDPDEAERMGAFRETALSEADAWGSNASLDDADTSPEAGEQSRYKAGQPVNKLAARGDSRNDQ